VAEVDLRELAKAVVPMIWEMMFPWVKTETEKRAEETAERTVEERVQSGSMILDRGWHTISFAKPFDRTPSVVVTAELGEGWYKRREFEPPEIVLPKVEIPDVEVARVRVPKIEVPEVKAPTITPVIPPKVELPALAKIKTPKIEKLKPIEVPKIGLKWWRCRRCDWATLAPVEPYKCPEGHPKYYIDSVTAEKAVGGLFKYAVRKGLGDWKVFNWLRDLVVDGSGWIGKILARVFANLMEGIEGWNKDLMGRLVSELNVELLPNIKESVDEAFAELPDEIKGKVDGMMAIHKNKMKKNYEEMASRLKGSIDEAFKKLAGEFTKSLAEGFGDLKTNLDKAFATSAGNVTDALKKMEIEKELRKLRDSLAEGFGKLTDFSIQAINESIEIYHKEVLGYEEGKLALSLPIRNVTATRFEVFVPRRTRIHYVAR